MHHSGVHGPSIVRGGWGVSIGMNRFLERLPLVPDKAWQRYGGALTLSLVALAMRLALAAIIPPGFPFVTFFPAAIVAAFLFGAGPGALTAVIGGVAGWLLFIPSGVNAWFAYDARLATAIYLGVVGLTILLIHWMQRATANLRAERQRGESYAAHADLLFHELQHRVANNLQMIGSVLSLQRRAITDPAASKALGDAVAKLHTIGKIQRQLYQPNGAHLALDHFLSDLALDLIEAGGRPGIECKVKCQPGVQLEPHAAIPIALIMAEAVANAVEHGFHNRDGGRIDVSVEPSTGWLTLTVTDDGAGLPEAFDPSKASSLGLRIAKALAQQLGGKFTLTANSPQGTIAKVRFPVDRRASKKSGNTAR